MTEELEQANDVVEKYILEKYKENCIIIESFSGDNSPIPEEDLKELINETNGYLHLFFGDGDEKCDEYYYHLYVVNDNFTIVRGKLVI